MRLAFRLLPFAVIAVVGCANRGNVDLLEARLREQEDQLRSLHAQVQQTKTELTASRRLNESLKQQLVQPASHGENVDLEERHFRVKGLKINSLLTGGIDRDGQPGDDQVTVVFAPVDDQGNPVRTPGSIECALLDPAQPAASQRLGLWTFDSQKSEAAWSSTLGNFGYRLELPWQTPPSSRDLVLHIRLNAANGSQFETSGPIRVTLSPLALGADQSMP